MKHIKILHFELLFLYSHIYAPTQTYLETRQTERERKKEKEKEEVHRIKVYNF